MGCDLFRKVICCNQRKPGWWPGFMRNAIVGLAYESAHVSQPRFEAIRKEFIARYRNLTEDELDREIMLHGTFS